MVHTERGEEVVERPRVMAACWGPGSPATALAMLDEAGQLVAFMFAGALSGPQRAPHPNDPPLFHDANRKACPFSHTDMSKGSLPRVTCKATSTMPARHAGSLSDPLLPHAGQMHAVSL